MFDPIQFLEEAVQTPSHEDVTAMRSLLADELADHGQRSMVDEAGNLIASRGRNDGPHVVLNTHIDTVPPHIPFERDGDVVRGRGSCDAKGPLAALVASFLAVEPTNGRVTLAVTPDEETESSGAAALDLDADAVIVGEPTGLDVCTAAKGRFQATVELRGESAHAAHPEAGANAIQAVAPVLDAVASFDNDRDSHDALGDATLTPTVVDGGAATNQVPAACRLVVDRRSVPPESAAEFRQELTSVLDSCVPAGVAVDVSLADRETPFLQPFDTSADSQLASTLQAASGGEIRPFTAATEASYFATGVASTEPAPTVVFGPGRLADDNGPVAHADREYVRLLAVLAAADAVEATLMEIVG